MSTYNTLQYDDFYSGVVTVFGKVNYVQDVTVHEDPPVAKPHVGFPAKFNLKQLKAFSPSVVPDVGINLAHDPSTAAMQLGPESY